MLDFLLNLDGNILLFIQEYLRNPIMTPLVKFITTLGNGGGIWIALTLLLLIIPKTRKVGWMMMTALLGTLLVNNIILKNLVARTRPYEVIAGLTYLVPKPGEYSFPSGHAVFFGGLRHVQAASEEVWGSGADSGNSDCAFAVVCGSALSQRCAVRYDQRYCHQLRGSGDRRVDRKKENGGRWQGRVAKVERVMFFQSGLFGNGFDVKRIAEERRRKTWKK